MNGSTGFATRRRTRGKYLKFTIVSASLGSDCPVNDNYLCYRHYVYQHCIGLQIFDLYNNRMTGIKVMSLYLLLHLACTLTVEINNIHNGYRNVYQGQSALQSHYVILSPYASLLLFRPLPNHKQTPNKCLLSSQSSHNNSKLTYSFWCDSSRLTKWTLRVRTLSIATSKVKMLVKRTLHRGDFILIKFKRERRLSATVSSIAGP